MKNDFVKQITEFNKTAAETVKALSDINVKAVKALSEMQYKIFNIVLDAGSSQIALATEAKDAGKLIAEQTKLVKETGEKVVAVAGTSKDIAETYKAELTDWVEEGVKTAQASVKKVA